MSSAAALARLAASETTGTHSNRPLQVKYLVIVVDPLPATDVIDDPTAGPAKRGMYILEELDFKADAERSVWAYKGPGTCYAVEARRR